MPGDGLQLDNRYHYSGLNREEKRLYRFMVECILKREYKIVYKYAPLFDLVGRFADGVPTLSQEYDETVCFGDVYSAIRFDFPEFYYIRHDSDISIEPSGGIIDMEPRCALRYSDAEIDRLNKKLNMLYHHFDDIRDEYALEVAVVKFIVNNYEYDYGQESYKRGSKRRIEAHTVAGLLKRGQGVCSAISQLAQYIFTRRGMSTALMRMGAAGDNDAHAWLAVMLGGSYYHLDITSILTEAKNPLHPQLTSFNITDSEMISRLGGYDTTAYPGIICRARRYNYYRREGLYFKSLTEAENAVRMYLDSIAEHDCGRYYFRMPAATARRDISQMLRRIIDIFPTRQGKYTYIDGYCALEVVNKPQSNKSV